LPYLAPSSISPGWGLAVYRPARSSSTGHGGSLGGARRPAMEEAHAEFIRHRSHLLRPHSPVSSSPRRRRPPRPCYRPPTRHRPCHLLARRASTGPTVGKSGNGCAQRGAEQAKPQFKSGYSGCFPSEAVLGCRLAQLRPKQLPKLLGKLCQTDP
jgi:hypothetical protein